jgi:acyl dehydratase
MTKYYQDFGVGEEFVTPGRTIGEYDIASFAGLSGDMYSLHTNELFAKGTRFRGLIAHGTLTLSIATGLWHRLGLYDSAEEKTLVALYGFDNVRFIGPVRVGDTVSVRAKVVQKREKEADGIVSLLNEVVNQQGTIVLTFVAHLLFKKR